MGRCFAVDMETPEKATDSDRTQLDDLGLVRMTEEACWTFLERHHLGRVAVVDFGRPVVYPVNYGLDGRRVVFRTAPGTKLISAALGGPATFEVDEADPLFESGSSVMVHGHLREITEPGERARLLQLPIRPWAPGARDHVVCVEPERVSGRQISVTVADALAVDGG